MIETTAASASDEIIAIARDVLQIEAKAISDLIARLDGSFSEAVRLIQERRGRVVVSGIGKSGHIARKIASTLASTGTPSFFVHPAEASHGDLGMVLREDVFIALSNSGESAEVLAIVPLLKRQGAKLIAFTGNADSTLAREADVHLYASAEKEACPLNLAPTASTTAALALGDALAVALMHAKGFTRDEFALSHPGGTLGRRLLTHVRDVMRTGENAPTRRSGCDADGRAARDVAGRHGHDCRARRHGARHRHFHRRRLASHARKRRRCARDADPERHGDFAAHDRAPIAWRWRPSRSWNATR